jgi:hypothetical protein
MKIKNIPQKRKVIEREKVKTAVTTIRNIAMIVLENNLGDPNYFLKQS